MITLGATRSFLGIKFYSDGPREDTVKRLKLITPLRAFGVGGTNTLFIGENYVRLVVG